MVVVGDDAEAAGELLVAIEADGAGRAAFFSTSAPVPGDADLVALAELVDELSRDRRITAAGGTRRGQSRSNGGMLGGMGRAAGRPVIGITAYPRMVETATGPALLHTVSRFYVESVERAGGVPVILPVLDPDTVE